MRTFNTGRGRFYEPVQIIGGAKTRAIIQRANISDNPQTSNPDFPKIACRVLPSSILKTGQVITINGGGNYLLASHSATSDYTLFHMLRADRQMAWERKTLGSDPLTHLPIDTGSRASLGSLWVMSERVRRQFTDTDSHFNVENLLIATGAAVLTNDFLGGQVVKRVQAALGVFIVELQG